MLITATESSQGSDGNYNTDRLPPGGMDNPFEIGLRLPSDEAIDCVTQMELAAAADEAGYDWLLTSESWGYDAISRLGYLAATTDAVLGTSIVQVHSRTPSLLAQSIATIAELSGGRAILGVGLSSPAVVENWHGAAFEPALRRQRETIEIVRTIMDGEPIEYDGQLYDVEFGPLRFEPPSDISVYVGAQGETNVELTGAFADGWIPSYVPASSLEDAREPLVRGAQSRDRDPEAIDVVPSVVTCVLEDGARARQRCRETVAFYVGAMGEFHRNALARHGYAETAEHIHELWSGGDCDAARAAVTDELLDDVALAGPPEHARDLLAAREGTIDGLITNPATRSTAEEIRETVEHLGRIVSS